LIPGDASFSSQKSFLENIHIFFLVIPHLCVLLQPVNMKINWLYFLCQWLAVISLIRSKLLHLYAL